jgi:signal transduction histidine kinase
MRIATKTAAVLLGIFVALLLGAWIILESAVRPGFERLEAEAHESDKARIEAQLETLAQSLRARVIDYASWDDTYNFVAGQNPAYVDNNFTDEWLGSYDLDLALFSDDSGAILWSNGRSAADEVTPDLARAHAVLRSARAAPLSDEPITGIYWAAEGPMMFAASPSTHSDGSGQKRGMVVFARRISSEALGTQVQLDIQLISAANAPPELAARLPGLEDVNSETWTSAHTLQSLIALHDARGDLVGAVLGTRARDVTALGVQLIRTALLLFAIMSALAVAALWVLLRRVVISRIVRLEQHFNAQSTAIEPLEANAASSDEIGSLTAAYNALVIRLRDVMEREHAANLAREAAAAANRMKSDFLANISHELRTPLNAVIGYSELIEEELADQGLDVATADLHRIRAAGRHLLSLITEILDLSKIEAGRMELAPSSFKVVEMIGTVIDTISPLAKQQGNVLSVDIEAGLGTAYSDELRLRQSLINILSNACKFTSNGIILIRARRVIANDRELLRFEVKDTGLGMTPDQLARVFEPFVQADASISRRFGGTGLGLAITRKIMSLLGGEIEATSSEGHGSTFVLTLPAIATDVTPVVSAKPAITRESEAA